MSVSDGLLRKHVLQSNLIENIVSRPGKPLYDSHLIAAKVAAEGKIVRPNRLHKLLASGVPSLSIHGGKYRACAVWVGEKEMPHFKNVPMLMEDWWYMVGQYKSLTKDFDEAAHFLHAWFLCIHPYVDGNGRTARLVWNMLRINKGLLWHVVEAKNKSLYYIQIHRIEIVFKEHYPDVYPTNDAT